MSRNLCRTDCRQCGSPVRLTGEASWYNNEFHKNMANAECTICRARYTAWLGNNHVIDDLSYRSTFNDEPGEDDIPAKQIDVFKLVVVDGEPFLFRSEP